MLELLTFLMLFSWGIIYFCRRTRLHLATNNHYLIVGELLVPLVVLTTIGIGGLQVLISFPSSQDTGGYVFEPFDVVFAGLVFGIAAVVYVVSFRALSGKPSTDQKPVPAKTAENTQVLLWCLIIFLVLDVAARMYKIQAGTYILWFADIADPERESRNPLVLFSHITPPLVAALLVWRAREHARWWFVAAAFVCLVAMEARRQELAHVFLAGGLTWMYLQGKLPTRKTVLVSAGAFFLLVGFVWPVIQEVRLEMRTDVHSIRYTGKASPMMILEYLPGVISWSRLHGEDSQRLQDGSPLLRRSKIYAFYSSAIVHKADIFFGSTSHGSLSHGLLQGIPSILLPFPKPDFHNTDTVHRDLGLGGYSPDPAGTVVADMYAHGGLVGLIVLMTVFGLFVAIVFNAILRLLPVMGQVLCIGLWKALLIDFNAWQGLLGSMRNLLIVLVVVYIVHALCGRKNVLEEHEYEHRTA